MQQSDFSRAVQVAAALDLVLVSHLVKKGVLNESDLNAIAAETARVAEDPETKAAMVQWVSKVLGLSPPLKP